LWWARRHLWRQLRKRCPILGAAAVLRRRLLGLAARHVRGLLRLRGCGAGVLRIARHGHHAVRSHLMGHVLAVHGGRLLLAGQ
jgi:hypothetical protein